MHNQRCQAAGCGHMHASLFDGADFKGPCKVNRKVWSASATANSHGEIASIPFDTRKRCERLGTNYYIQGSKVALPLVQVSVSSSESGKMILPRTVG